MKYTLGEYGGAVKSVLYIEIEGNKNPFAKIVDEQNQVIFSPLAIKGDHLTVHKKKDGSGYVFTYSDNNKIERVWDNARVELAKKEGYKNPEKHRNYIANRSMAYCDGYSIPLIVLHVKDNHYLHRIPEKYIKLKESTIRVTNDHFELAVYFCSNEGVKPPPNFHSFKTSIGTFGFEAR